MENNSEGLKREIGVWGLNANMINGIVGAAFGRYAGFLIPLSPWS
ncbi:MAG: hypothetical protein NTV01_12105 [Bacteroidia bacterium]|nr:hypothetical protein [Bacteroidia bacterium]